MEELKYEVRKIKIDQIKILGLILAIEGSILKAKNIDDSSAEMIGIMGLATMVLASLAGLITTIKYFKDE